MIIDLERDGTPPEFHADVCIVGAGAAGISLAAELVRQGRQVVLLESGGAIIEPAAQALNQCLYTGQPYRGASIGRFRALGGTTTAWGGQILEFTKGDFAPRSWAPGSGWPFSKEELAPYYRRALTSEGLADVYRSDDEIWQKMKLSAPELGEYLEPYFTRWCPEPNFSRLYRETMASPNLCVVLHATATAMLLDESGARVCGVRCKTLAGQEHTFSAAYYALCLGTIETVRFLLQPSPVKCQSSWNQSGLLGRHFQSHIDFDAAHVPAKSAQRLHSFFANAYLNRYKYHPKFRLSDSMQQREEVLNIAGSITCIHAQEHELQRIKLLARNLLRGNFSGAHFKDLSLALRQGRTMLGLAYGYAIEHRAYWPKLSRFWLRVHCEQEPLSDSGITLTETRDATGLLQAKLDWRVSTLEWRTIRCFAEEVKRTFVTRGWGNIAVQPELAMEDGFRNITFDDSHHHMGGTRMSISAADGVVDPNLRLHGVDNAYVCSASVFPTSGFSNPTHTLIALAIRLADHLIHCDSSNVTPVIVSKNGMMKDAAHD